MVRLQGPGFQQMTTLLRIDTSITGRSSASRELTDHYVAAWKRQLPATRVVTRDLGLMPVPHLDPERLAALSTPREERSADQHRIFSDSERWVSEIEAADAIVIGMPMYNFQAPSAFKAWFDHVARAGRTFRYTESGPEGLLSDRPVQVISTRGGIHEDSGRDWQTPWLRQALGLLGLEDLRLVTAEGLNLSDVERRRSMNRARVLVESAAMIAAECTGLGRRVAGEAV